MSWTLRLLAGVAVLAGCAAPAGSAQPTPFPSPLTTAPPSAPPTALPTPTPVTGGCSLPDTSPFRLADIDEVDAACLRDDVTLIGWIDDPPAIGFMPPGIDPSWLWFSTPVLWGEPPTRDGVGWMPIAVDPASGMSRGPTGRWVLVTGHKLDPRAETCHYVYPPDWGAQPTNDDEQARETCRQSFVVTAIEETEAPGP